MSGCSSSPLASSDALAPESTLVVTPAPGASGTSAASTSTASAGPHPAALSLAALYARVSTDKQEKDATIASQVEALQTAAAAAGYTVPPDYVFQDDGYSGARLDRPALDRLRDLAADGAFAAVFVYAPDRLARHYAYQVLVWDELRAAGCAVVFLNHAFGSTPEEQMLLQMQGVFAEYERAIIRERTRRGRLFAARAGRASWGRPPYGYRYLPKTETTPQQLLIAEAEADVVRQMYRWLVEEHLTSYAIEKRLTTSGLRTRTGHLWRQSSVIDILRSPLYKGEGYYNRTCRADAWRPHLQTGYKDRRPGNERSRRLRPPEEWIAVAVPAIIEASMWDQAQEQLARNREQARRHNTAHQYLLRGLLVCGRCGRRMTGSWVGNTGRYVCSARYPSHAPDRCDGPLVAAAPLEAQVWDYVQALLADPALLRAQYQAAGSAPDAGNPTAQEERRLERQLAGLERENRRLLDAYQAGVIELAELQERRQRLGEQQHLAQERAASLRQQQVRQEQEQQALAGVEAFCAGIQAALNSPDFAVQQQVLRLVVDRVVLEEDKLVIHHIIPTGPVGLQTDHHPVHKPSSALPSVG